MVSYAKGIQWKNRFLIHIWSILHGVMVDVGSPWPKHIPTSLDFVKLLNGLQCVWGKLDFVKLLNCCNFVKLLNYFFGESMAIIFLLSKKLGMTSFSPW